MPEEPQGGAGTGTATEPQGGAGTDPANSNGRTGPDGQPWDPDRAMRTIEQLREEAKAGKAAAAERDALAAKVREFEQKSLSETEKLQRERDEAIARAQKAEGEIEGRETTAAIEAAAARAGAKSGRAGAVARLVDRSAIERDAEGKPTNLDALVEATRTDAPELFEPRKPTGDAEGGARSTGSTRTMSDVIRRGFGRGA
jgi:hypothetical protein